MVMRYVLLIALLISSMAVSSQVNDCQRWKEYGMLCGKFSVSETKQVYFSKGNLQYQASTDTWRFAERQYDRILADNRFRSSSYSGWIDLFGWGHSGYGNQNPYDSKSHYPLVDGAEKGIAGTNYDWGVCNKIINGGNKEGLWRTLTADEWKYLVDQRPYAKNLRLLATVCGVEGLVFLPDDFVRPSDFSFLPMSDDSVYNGTYPSGTYFYCSDNTNFDYQENIYDERQWSVLESLGALFLPIADGCYDFECYSGWHKYKIRRRDSVLCHKTPLSYWNCCREVFYWTASATLEEKSEENGVHPIPIAFFFSDADISDDEDYTKREYNIVFSGFEGWNCSVRLVTDVSDFLFEGRKEREETHTEEPLKPEGTLPGLFSISDSMQVQFSMGNLQYQPRSGVWRFAKNQYDLSNNEVDVSSYEGKVYCDSPDYAGWLDAFAWGASGWQANLDFLKYEEKINLPNARGYRGIDFRVFSNEYERVMFMRGERRNLDWGIYNAISNGGNKAGLWRTLSDKEWTYLLAERPHANELRARAMVFGSEGYMLLPDDFQLPEGLSFTPRSKDYITNRYDTKEEWRKMEAAGALFLPVRTKPKTDNRYNLDYIGGGYWTDRGGNRYAVAFHVDSSNVDIDYDYVTHVNDLRYVRLVSNSSIVKKNKRSDVMATESVHVKRHRKPREEVEGALPGLFSVSDSGQVRFSKGNLQYLESTDTWRFALNQYDVMQKSAKYCSSDDSIREPLTEWIDEFGWGSSGYDNRKPASRCNLSLQGPAAADPAGFSDSCYANYDWGVYNKIDNGGCEKGLWRTLSREEWHYLLKERRDAEKLRSRAVVCGVYGYMILPDDFILPEGLHFIPRCQVFYNDYDEEQWKRLETAGAVFLPCQREWRDSGLTHRYGACWTSSASLSNSVSSLSYDLNDEDMFQRWYNDDIDCGALYLDNTCSVRLVTDR